MSVPEEHRRQASASVSFAVITVSDTRTLETDKSGLLIAGQMQKAGHQLLTREIVPDDPQHIIASVQAAVQQGLDAVLLTGGTGVAARDQTPEAIEPLIEVPLPGFGELFRMLSYEDVGPAAMLSRAFAGRIGGSFIFCMPGSTAAVQLAMEKLIVPEINHLVSLARS